MKKICVLVLSTVALTAAAQNKIDFQGRLVIEEARLERTNTGDDTVNTLKTKKQSVAKVYNVLVEFNDNNIDFGDVNVEVITVIGEGFATVAATAEQMEALAELPQVKSITLGDEIQPRLKAARSASHVDEVHVGTGLDKAYTGKGVIVGLFDTGLDPNHVNFLDANGEPRTKELYVYSSGNPVAYTTPQAIKNYTTEKQSESHGTHVLGIMAGSYKGAADYAIAGSSKATITRQTDATSAMPYYGVAPDADLVITCGTMSNANIVSGVGKIMDYAKKNNKPAVVNLSLGNNIGPHDGSDATSKALDVLGKQGIICISAGNEGYSNISLSTTGSLLKSFTATESKAPNRASGSYELWASDDQPFTFRIFAYNRANQQEMFSYTLDSNLKGATVQQSDMPGFSGNSSYSGTIKVSSNVDTSNGRYNVSVQVNLSSSNQSVLFGFAVEPKAGQAVDIFTGNMEFMSQGQPGFTDGNPDNSINGLACGENLIVVGSYSTARTFPMMSGSMYSYGGVGVGMRSDFSSYGWVTPYGRSLPDVCAPGEVLVSSFSKYYVESKNMGTGEYSGSYTTGGDGLFDRKSYWGPMQGTSMASPMAAGVIALWLEANPYLNVSEIRDILYKTSYVDLVVDSEPEKWGAGKIDALEGIKEVIATRSGVNDVATDTNDVVVSSTDSRTYQVYVAGAKKVTVNLYSLAGTQVAHSTAGTDTVKLSTEGLNPGVYVMSIESDKTNATRKIMVK